MTAKEHNQTLGILFLIFGGCNLLLLIPATLQIISAFKQFDGLSQRLENAKPEYFQSYFNFLLILVGILGVFSVVSSVIQITAGFGMIKHKPWGYRAGVLAAIIMLISLPIGTALGIYALWFLFGKTSQRFYESQLLNVTPSPPKN